jgi:thioredoxin reductase (NADPH)
MNTYDILIIGSGPAGLTAAIYTSRANLKTAIIAGDIWGGQLMLTTDVENYPGFAEGIQGPQLMEAMRKQVTRFGADWVEKNVTKVDFSSSPFKIWTGELETRNSKLETYSAHSVIIATGAETKWLGVPGEQQFIGRGVSSCAPCDAAFFKNKRVYVIGGGDAAMEEALVLTKLASEVTLIHRRDAFRASQIMGQRVLGHDKIKVFWDTEVLEFHGGATLQSVTLKTSQPRWGKDRNFMLDRGQGKEGQIDGECQLWNSSIDGAFVAIGHVPSTSVFKDQITLDKKGYLLNGLNGLKEHRNGKQETDHCLWLEGYPTMTSVPGIFAVGDGFDYRYRQAITAAGYGCMGAMDAEKWLEEKSLAAISLNMK